MTRQIFAALCLLSGTLVTVSQNTHAQGNSVLADRICRPVASATGTPSDTSSLPTPAQLFRVNRDFAAQFARQQFAGVTAGVVVRDQLIWTRSYGLADIENGVRATANTVYNMGSMGKQFTAVMFLQLIDSGRVHASDPVSLYVPEISQIQNPFSNAPPPTLFELATHTAGLTGEMDEPRGPQGTRDEWEQLLISVLPQVKYDFPPGTHYQYSNIGYALLGLALERAAAQKYLDYLPQQILIPLGMTHTGYTLTPDMAAHVAKGYTVSNGAPVLSANPAQQPIARAFLTPAGGMFTTVGDLAKFISLELGYGPDAVLSKATIANNFASVASANGELSFGYGIGFGIQRQGTSVIAGHNGGVSVGYYATGNIRPKSDVGVVFLSNIFSSSAGQYAPFDVLDVLTCSNPELPQR